MFKILYQPAESEQLDESELKAAGFDGIESDRETSLNIPIISLRCADLELAITAVKTGKYAAVSYQPKENWVAETSAINQQMAGKDGLLLVKPWSSRRTVRELWQLAESIHSKNVKLSISSEWGKAYEQVAARVVPTLNHRIGAVCVKSDETEIALDYARRLAGIGYNGLLVIGNPANTSGVEVAGKLAESVRHLLQPPVKPKAAVAKAPVKKPVSTP